MVNRITHSPKDEGHQGQNSLAGQRCFWVQLGRDNQQVGVAEEQEES